MTLYTLGRLEKKNFIIFYCGNEQIVFKDAMVVQDVNAIHK